MTIKFLKKNALIFISILSFSLILSAILFKFNDINSMSNLSISGYKKDTNKLINKEENRVNNQTMKDTSIIDISLDEIPTSNICTNSTEKILKRNNHDSLNSTPRILMLGDSHLMGQFGEFLQLDIHETGLFDILSISIGGAGSASYTYQMRNNCCGYVIRESIHDEKILSGKKIRKLEYKNHKTNEIIGKKYAGHIANVLAEITPDIVMVALGSNLTNNHQGLIDIIKANSPNAQIVWIGPMKCKKIGIRVKTIQQAVLKNNIYFVRSDDLVGSDNATMEHLSGVEAKKWAYNIYIRMKPLIELYSRKKDSIQYYSDSLTSYTNVK